MKFTNLTEDELTGYALNGIFGESVRKYAEALYATCDSHYQRGHEDGYQDGYSIGYDEGEQGAMKKCPSCGDTHDR